MNVIKAAEISATGSTQKWVLHVYCRYAVTNKDAPTMQRGVLTL